MKTFFKSLFVVAILALFAVGTEGFAGNKKKNTDRRRRAAAFTSSWTSPVNYSEESNSLSTATTTTTTTSSPSASTPATAPHAFALPQTSMATALSAAAYEYDYNDIHEDDDVSYGVALVSCVLSLAVGFGTGYLV